MTTLTARSIIRYHYGLDRRVTDKEVADEIASLIRKHAAMSLDDKDERLYHRLAVAGYIND